MALGLVTLALCSAAWALGWTAAPSALLWLCVGAAWVLAGAALVKGGVAGWPLIPRPLRVVAGVLVLALAWLAMAQARVIGVNFLLSILVLVWVADIFAYFAGRAFGGKFTQRGLAPLISPKKSWEGVWGGMAGVVVLAIAWTLADGATLLPIDSEHSAIFQSLPEDHATWDARVEKIILTASGGPFRTRAAATLRNVTPEEACAHPNWVMGRKISVDSATMMNKALEVIEARYLFGLPPQRLQVVIHPQSVIHSMVQYRDTSVVAQLGTPDMRVPIAYGLAWPERVESGAQALDFGTLADMSFESLDSRGHRERFPGLQLAWDCLAAAPGTPAVLNAANEVAVAAFLDRRIRFDQIHSVNLATLEALAPSKPHSLQDLLALDAEARRAAETAIRRLAT